LESAVSQKRRKTEANLEKDLLEEAGKCNTTWSEIKRLAGNSQMEMLHKSPMFLMEPRSKYILEPFVFRYLSLSSLCSVLV
jgi:hypothetical protein